MRQRRPPVLLAATAVTVVLLLGGSYIVGSARASPVPATPFSPAWAFGAHANSTFSGTGVKGAYVYTFHAFFGWDTILTQTNTSATTFLLESQRTVGADFYVSECRPTCSQPVSNLTTTYRAWEVDTGFANYTSAGTVYVAGQPVPAYALLDGSFSVRANVTTGGNSTYRGVLNVLHGSFSSYVSATASSSIAFTPYLGLYPISPSVGESWNASSGYASNGSWAWSFVFEQSKMDGLVIDDSNHSSGSLHSSGNVSLSGTDGGTLALDGGLLTHAIALTTGGDFPFHLGDGVFFLPQPTDIFSDSGQAWQEPQPGNTSAATYAINVAAGEQGHFSLFASATTYMPSSTDVAPASPTSIAPADGPAPATLQAQPESVSLAQSNQACLVAGNCPSQGPAPAVRTPDLVRLGIVVVGVAAVLVAALVVVERRRESPPAHPNARLYPPEGSRGPTAAGSAPAPPRGAVTGRPNGEPEPDPLGHLW